MWASHEARAAQNAQRMLDDGDWLLPRLFDGQVELQKPPGYYWLAAAVGKTRGGVDAVAVRLPAAVAGVLTVLLIWWHLKNRGRPIAAFLAGAMLAGAVHFTGTARVARIDVPLACAVAAIVLGCREALDRGTGRLRSATLLTGVGFVAGIALLLKGPIGVLLPAAAFGTYWLVERFPRRQLILPAVGVGLVAVATAAPWYVWANAETDGEFFRSFFLYHHLNRAFGGAEALAAHPWWFYGPRFAADFLPWTPLLVVALFRRWRGDADARFGLVWLVVMVVGLSVSRFKRADYLLPAYGGAAIFLGCAIERWYRARSTRMQTRAAIGFVALLVLLPIAWVGFDRIVTSPEEAAREQRPFADVIRAAAPAPQAVTLFRVEAHLLVYHLGRPVHTLVEWDDLNSRLSQPGSHFVVTRAEFLDECRRQIAWPVEVVARSEDVSRARPLRPLVLLQIVSGPEPCPTVPRD